MGRQFSYFYLPEDLDLIQREVFTENGCHLLEQQRNANGQMTLVSANRFALDCESMGGETLLLLLAPDDALANFVWKQTLSGAAYLDTSNSHVIEIGRCFTDGKVIRSSRFWYEARTFDGQSFGEKPEAFTKDGLKRFSPKQRDS